jgi:hypothetical protein
MELNWRQVSRKWNCGRVDRKRRCRRANREWDAGGPIEIRAVSGPIGNWAEGGPVRKGSCSPTKRTWSCKLWRKTSNVQLTQKITNNYPKADFRIPAGKSHVPKLVIVYSWPVLYIAPFMSDVQTGPAACSSGKIDRISASLNLQLDCGAQSHSREGVRLSNSC